MGHSYENAYRTFGKRYPNVGYGAMFQDWLHSSNRRPYQSCGNGAAMRAGVIGEYFDTLEEVERQAALSAQCTHNHPEGIKGAKAAAVGVFLARIGCSKRKSSAWSRSVTVTPSKPPWCCAAHFRRSA